MATITLQGDEIHTNGDLPALGAPAPEFTLVDADLNDRRLADYAGKKKLLNIVPSLDTPVCAISTKKFNDHAKGRAGVVVVIDENDKVAYTELVPEIAREPDYEAALAAL